MSSRIINKQTGLTYEPPDAPGIVVEYTLHPEQPFMPATRDSEGQEYYPPRVEVETVHISPLSDGNRKLLTDLRSYVDWMHRSMLGAESIPMGKSAVGELLKRIDAALDENTIDLLPWLQEHGADQDEVIARLEEGIAGNHR